MENNIRICEIFEMLHGTILSESRRDQLTGVCMRVAKQIKRQTASINNTSQIDFCKSVSTRFRSKSTPQPNFACLVFPFKMYVSNFIPRGKFLNSDCEK